MKEDDLDAMLAANEGPGASRAFSPIVMAAVHREAAQPVTPPFPWLRFAVGICASAVMGISAGTALGALPVPTVTIPAQVAAAAPDLASAAAVVIAALCLAAVPRVLSRL